MISQLINEVYYVSKLEKKPWFESSKVSTEWERYLALNLSGRMDFYRPFLYENQKIDSLIKLKTLLEKVDLSILESSLIDELYWQKAYRSLVLISSSIFLNLSITEKCQVLKISDYLHDRDIQKIIDLFEDLK